MECNEVIDPFFETQYYQEEHCEECMEVMHVHFNCPICFPKYNSETNINMSLEDYREDGTDEFGCRQCNSMFRILCAELGFMDLELI